jgi:low temperature requirement protein LtrA
MSEDRASEIKRAWQTPTLRDDDPDARHRVGWLELFFDLVFVVIVAVLAENLADNEGLLPFAIQFTAVFWVWNGFTYYTERFESTGLDNRLFTFIAILAVGGLAIWGHGGLGANYLLFAGSYVAARLLNIALWLRAGYHNPRFRRATFGFTGGFLVAVALLAVSLFVPIGWRLALFSAAVVLEIFTPQITGRFQRGLPQITRDKFPERFGLLTLIVLGETVTQVILSVAAMNSVARLPWPALLLSALGLLIGFELWWLYFDFVARRQTSQIFSVILAWIYLHLVMLIGIVVIGVGLSEALAHLAAFALPPQAREFLLVGAAVVVMAIGLIELTLDRALDEPTHPVVSPALKVGAAIILGAVAASGLVLNELATFALVIVAFGVQAAYGARVYYRRRQ